jgi:hypothetical protein
LINTVIKPAISSYNNLNSKTICAFIIFAILISAHGEHGVQYRSRRSRSRCSTVHRLHQNYAALAPALPR